MGWLVSWDISTRPCSVDGEAFDRGGGLLTAYGIFSWGRLTGWQMTAGGGRLTGGV